MKIDVIYLGDIGVNCYMINSENSAVVIDPGFKSEFVTDFLKNNSNKERLIMLTHTHFDHISAALDLSRETNTKIAIGSFDNSGLSDPNINLANLFGAVIEPFSADILLNDGNKFSVGDLEFTVMHTPGHTIGGVCYILENYIFSGDVLFYESIGRTDFPGGDFSEIKKSIFKIYDFDDDMIIYSGHGPKTTVGHEKIYNPYVRAN